MDRTVNDVETLNQIGTIAPVETIVPLETVALSTKKLASRSGGVQTMCELRRYQKSTKHLIPSRPFRKFIRDLVYDIVTHDLKLESVPRFKVKVESNALEGIQYYTEDYMVKLMTRAHANAIHAHRITVQPKDIKLVKFVQSNN
jgi:histone H3/H4